MLIIKEPILKLPDLKKPCKLTHETLEFGAALMQEHDNQLFPVSLASKKLSKREKAYATVEKECLAVIWAVMKFMMYLYGKEFILQTDHQSLVYLVKAKFTNNRVMRWALYLQSYKDHFMYLSMPNRMYLYGKEFILQTDHQSLVYLDKAKFTNDRVMRWALYLQSYKDYFIKGCYKEYKDALIRMAIMFIIHRRRHYDKATLAQLSELGHHETNIPGMFNAEKEYLNSQTEKKVEIF
ncbi:Retrovirus-related Pol polyprotein from transposon 297 [Exaiptasia diaphana]|nr:Retrovirus-related Pol polyprotein from transposon 297 [Exaiptasia diaphana]